MMTNDDKATRGDIACHRSVRRSAHGAANPGDSAITAAAQPPSSSTPAMQEARTISIAPRRFAVRLGLACALAAGAGLTAPVSARQLADLAYGPAPRQKVDVYLPENRPALPGGAPILVMVHGG